MQSTFLDQYEIIIFDCDGVLIDSNLLKCEAFGKAVGGYSSEIVENFVNHCRKTFGISRYVKFKEFFNDFANETFNEDKYNNMLNKYSAICKDIYDYAKITPGCERLLFELSNSGKSLYVASGSDEKELIEVFFNRNLIKYFSRIYGSPKSKLECTSTILENHPKKRGVFIGDSITDMKSAKENNLDFVYMTSYTVQSDEQDFLCRKGASIVIDTLEELCLT